MGMRSSKISLTRALFAFAVMGILLVPTAPAQAAGIIVTSLDDTTIVDGECTLREAITNANHDAATFGDCAAGTGADTITFAVSGTITLTSQLDATDADGLIIDGAGQSVVLDGGNTAGIFTVSALASFELRELTFQNARSANGGAIEVQAGSLTVVDSVIRNSVATFTGGGIRAASAVVTVTGSTISGNYGGQAGGGISLEGASTATIANTTISGNSVDLGNAQGGGVFVGNGASATLTNVTIADNVANRGGGMRNLATATLRNTIIANNTASIEGPDCTGTIASLGHNLIGDTTGCAFAGVASDLEDIDPMLGALTDSGGGRQTHALLDGSPAVDAGSNDACAAAPVSSVDERGVARPQGATCDIGAYEALQLSIADLAQVEGDAGASVFNAVITLSQGLPAGFPDVTVEYSTADGTATAGKDYTAVVGATLQFTAGGAATQNAGVLVSGDTHVEPHETFTVTLMNPVGAVISNGQGQATITILNDDAVPEEEPLTPITVDGVTTEYLGRTSVTPPANRLGTSGGGLGLVFTGEDLALAVYTLPFGANLSPALTPTEATWHGSFIIQGEEPFTPPVQLEVSLSGEGPYVVGRWDGARWQLLHTEVTVTDGRAAAATAITQGGLYAIFSGVRNPLPAGQFDPPVTATGVHIAAWTGGTLEQLEAALSETAAGAVWLLRDGRFVGYILGAPSFVNAAFLSDLEDGQLPPGTLMVVVR